VSGTAHISNLAFEFRFPTKQSWAMVRTHFDIRSFGVNAYVAGEPGVDLIGEHDEVAEGAPQHEELYFVSEGHATFTVNGDEIDAPAGTFVFVRDPSATRKAVATEVGTTILIVGGKPGEAFTPSPWERNAVGLTLYSAGEYEKAAETYERFLAESPGDATFLYNLACSEAQLGRNEQALEHLREAIEKNPRLKESAPSDPDLDPIRDDPEFSAITGQVDSAGAGS
jgi:tetratricopeptide (TPR) repeat protein